MRRSVVVGGLLISASLLSALLLNCSATQERAAAPNDVTVLKPRSAAVLVLRQADVPRPPARVFVAADRGFLLEYGRR